MIKVLMVDYYAESIPQHQRTPSPSDTLRTLFAHLPESTCDGF
jgi:hypothetical protein